MKNSNVDEPGKDIAARDYGKITTSKVMTLKEAAEILLIFAEESAEKNERQDQSNPDGVWRAIAKVSIALLDNEI